MALYTVTLAPLPPPSVVAPVSSSNPGNPWESPYAFGALVQVTHVGGPPEDLDGIFAVGNGVTALAGASGADLFYKSGPLAQYLAASKTLYFSDFAVFGINGLDMYATRLPSDTVTPASPYETVLVQLPSPLVGQAALWRFADPGPVLQTELWYIHLRRNHSLAGF